jgi:hypothetical protein
MPLALSPPISTPPGLATVCGWAYLACWYLTHSPEHALPLTQSQECVFRLVCVSVVAVDAAKGWALTPSTPHGIIWTERLTGQKLEGSVT